LSQILRLNKVGTSLGRILYCDEIAIQSVDPNKLNNSPAGLAFSGERSKDVRNVKHSRFSIYFKGKYPI
jgi:hypothetical protein